MKRSIWKEFSGVLNGVLHERNFRKKRPTGVGLVQLRKRWVLESEKSTINDLRKARSTIRLWGYSLGSSWLRRFSYRYRSELLHSLWTRLTARIACYCLCMDIRRPHRRRRNEAVQALGMACCPCLGGHFDYSVAADAGFLLACHSARRLCRAVRDLSFVAAGSQSSLSAGTAKAHSWLGTAVTIRTGCKALGLGSPPSYQCRGGSPLCPYLRSQGSHGE